jgi:hypothetical protein
MKGGAAEGADVTNAPSFKDAALLKFFDLLPTPIFETSATLCAAATFYQPRRGGSKAEMCTLQRLCGEPPLLRK